MELALASLSKWTSMMWASICMCIHWDGRHIICNSSSSSSASPASSSLSSSSSSSMEWHMSDISLTNKPSAHDSCALLLSPTLFLSYIKQARTTINRLSKASLSHSTARTTIMATITPTSRPLNPLLGPYYEGSSCLLFGLLFAFAYSLINHPNARSLFASAHLSIRKAQAYLTLARNRLDESNHSLDSKIQWLQTQSGSNTIGDLPGCAADYSARLCTCVCVCLLWLVLTVVVLSHLNTTVELAPIYKLVHVSIWIGDWLQNSKKPTKLPFRCFWPLYEL